MSKEIEELQERYINFVNKSKNKENKKITPRKQKIYNKNGRLTDIIIIAGKNALD